MNPPAMWERSGPCEPATLHMPRDYYSTPGKYARSTRPEAGYSPGGVNTSEQSAAGWYRFQSRASGYTLGYDRPDNSSPHLADSAIRRDCRQFLRPKAGGRILPELFHTLQQSFGGQLIVRSLLLNYTLGEKIPTGNQLVWIWTWEDHRQIRGTPAHSHLGCCPKNRTGNDRVLLVVSGLGGGERISEINRKRNYVKK